MSSPTWEEEIEKRLDNILNEVKVTQEMVGNCMSMPDVKIPPKKSTPVQEPPKKQDGKTEYSPINTLQVGEKSSRASKISVKGTLKYDPKQRDGTRNDGSTYTVASMVISDGTGELNISFWDKFADEAMEYHQGDLVLIDNLYQITGTYSDVLQANAGKYYKMCKLN